MSNIDSLDFAKYVDENKNFLKQILKLKGADVEEDESLNSYIEKVHQLRDKEDKPEEEYKLPKEWQDLLDEYETDPLLERNGGPYKYCHFAAYSDLYDELYMQGVSEAKCITSDRQEFDLTSDFITITWDKSKDLIREDGGKYRWLKVYCTHTYFKYASGYDKNYSTTEIKNKIGSLLFLIIDSTSTFSNSEQQSILDNCSFTEIESIILGYNVNSIPSKLTTKFSYSLKYLKSLTDITRIYSIDANNIQKLDIQLSKNLLLDKYIACNSYSLRDIDFLNNVETITETSSESSLINNYHGEYFNLTNLSKYVTTVNNPTILTESNYLKEISLPNLIIESPNNDMRLFVVTTNYFYNYKKLEKLILNPNVKLAGTSFTFGMNMEDVLMPNNIDINLNLSYATKLTKDSFNDTISKLADLTGQTAKVLTVNRYQYNIRLTEEQKNEIINKNWTITISN